MDRDRREEAADRFVTDQQGNHRQHKSATETRQIPELARTEREAAAAGMTPRQPIGAGRQPQRADMGRHMSAIGQKRHGVIGKAADDLHAHEHSGNNRRPFGASLGAGMTLAQEDMVAGPDAMVVWLFGIMIMAVIVPMVMVMIAMLMVMGMTVRMPIQGVVVRHGVSLARCQCKNS